MTSDRRSPAVRAGKPPWQCRELFVGHVHAPLGSESPQRRKTMNHDWPRLL